MATVRDVFLERAQFLFKIWYRIISLLDRKGHVVFMNYGFSKHNQKLELSPEEEPNRYSIQLYHHLAEHLPLKGKRVLEIGCGRGGGLSFLSKKHGPFHGTGMDLDRMAIKFCNRNHAKQDLDFQTGDAQNLPFEDNSADLILNVESSHRYPKFDHFLKEVHRVLKPGGSFLFTDFRYQHQIKSFFKSLDLSNLIKHHETNITEHILEALVNDDPRKRLMINRIAPWPINKIALEFAGTVGSSTHRDFSTGRWTYYSFHFTKPE